MKPVMAIIKPFKLDEVREALSAVGVTGLTVSEVKGFGRQGGHKEIYRGAEYEVHFVAKIRIEIAVSAEIADRAIETVRDAACSPRRSSAGATRASCITAHWPAWSRCAPAPT